MVKWKRWDKYEDVPHSVLNSTYGNKERIKARDPDYLSYLNEVYNPMPMSMQAKSKKGVPCFTCPAKLTPTEAERGRLCTTCEKKVREKKSVVISNGWGVRVTPGT